MSTMITKLRSLLKNCLKDSQAYVEAESLPAAAEVRKLIQDQEPHFLKKLTSTESFFVFELVPETRQTVPDQTVAEAYCNALKSLPADWWGLPGGTATENAQHLLSQPEITGCLVKLLDNTDQLRYVDGESNTLAKVHQWQVSDLAAGFLSSLSQQDFDADASVRDRAAVKQRLKRGG